MTASPLPETVPIASLAELFGVEDRQARNILASVKVKSRARGQFPLKEAVQAVIIQAREARAPDPLSLARARALNARAKAQEVALARAERELIPLDQAIEVMDAYCAAVVSELNGFSARVTRDLDLRRKIETELNAAQARMVAKLNKAAAELRDGDDDQEDGA